MNTLVLLAAASLCLFATQAHAFCVYNKIDQDFSVQVRNSDSSFIPKVFKRFAKTVKPGKSECCSWENRECNGSGERDRMLSVSNYWAKYLGKSLACRTYGSSTDAPNGADSELIEPSVQAGGYLSLDRNRSFDSEKGLSAENTPYTLNSYSYDDKRLASTPCY